MISFGYHVVDFIVISAISIRNQNKYKKVSKKQNNFFLI